MRLLFFVVLGLVGASSGCTPPCDSSNCGGCCTADGTCVPGTVAAVCGRSGAECVACGPRSSCTAGVCQLNSSVGGGSSTGGGGGSSTGGGGGSTGGGGGATCAFTDLGKGCVLGSECQSGFCFGKSPSLICTRACVADNDCPLHWGCTTTTAGGKVCMTGIAPVTPSTSSGCGTVTFNDIGGPCGNCQSKYCLSTLNACTRRCDVDADCPAPWTCRTGTDTFKSCRPP